MQVIPWGTIEHAVSAPAQGPFTSSNRVASFRPGGASGGDGVKHGEERTYGWSARGRWWREETPSAPEALTEHETILRLAANRPH